MSTAQIPAQWFVVCDLEGRLVGDLRLTNPPQYRGRRKELRTHALAMLEALERKDLIAAHNAPPSTQETTEQTETMKSNLMNEAEECGNGGGQAVAPPTGDTPPEQAGDQGNDQKAEDPAQAAA